ncbi:MAG TPA: hypothetical protein VLC98_11060 [Phnomibacter sp.]|nr:hypothetical protein [Phnomibacter sp.]
MDVRQIQVDLFSQVKLRLPDHLSLVDSVAAVLQISADSAYRRIRGEKAIDLLEAKQLCNHFNISLDALLGSQGSRIMFTSNHSAPGEFDFESYIKSVLKNMEYFHSFQNKKMFYECKDIPLFHQFHSRELAAFKYFFWRKFLFGQPSYKTHKYSLDDYPDELYATSKKIQHLYYTMPSVEFWNLESINSTLRQIDFFADTGGFRNKDDLMMVYESVKNLLSDLEQMCAKGEKPVLLKEDTLASPGAFECYNNEVVLGGNTILAIVGSGRMVFLNHSVFNYAVTTDLNFGMYMQNYLENLARSSTQISQVSEVERTAFFSTLQQTVQQRMDRL